jgi:phospholipid/cholesterol/gamma-HCH transport system substrate-binding protein
VTRALRAGVVLLAFALLGLAVDLTATALTGGGGRGGYLVRAVFDNSSFVIPGEDVKVAGVKVGSIQATELTPQNKAALVLKIDDKHFVPFHTDAHCEIGLESLLGEQFVQCAPTQPHAAGDPPAPALPAIRSGPNKGQHLLGVQNTTTPVGVDLLDDIQRLPQAERFRLIISGLGAGLAGNGQALNQALLRADPALQETDRVIAVLGRQDQTLAQLTDDSAKVLAPLAAQRAGLGGFFVHTGKVAEASAQEGQAIEANFKDFPPFLRQLEPYTQHLSNLADEMTPALQALAARAPTVNQTLDGLGSLAKASVPALQSLGRFAVRGESVFPKVHRVAEQLDALSIPLLPLATQIAGLAQSFDNGGGIEDVMRFIYYYGGSVNGEDAVSHYIRTLVEITQNTRTSTLNPGSSANFACTTGSAACGSQKAVSADAGVGTLQPEPASTQAAETAQSSAVTTLRRLVTPSSQPAEQSAKALIGYLLSR